MGHGEAASGHAGLLKLARHVRQIASMGNAQLRVLSTLVAQQLGALEYVAGAEELVAALVRAVEGSPLQLTLPQLKKKGGCVRAVIMELTRPG